MPTIYSSAYNPTSIARAPFFCSTTTASVADAVFAWGLGARSAADPLWHAAVWLIFFYFADRIVLAIAKRRLGFALHAATRLDGRVRSYIARRNITMTIMAFALLLGQGQASVANDSLASWRGDTLTQMARSRPRSRRSAPASGATRSRSTCSTTRSTG